MGACEWCEEALQKRVNVREEDFEDMVLQFENEMRERQRDNMEYTIARDLAEWACEKEKLRAVQPVKMEK
jgi:hypothetical protein